MKKLIYFISLLFVFGLVADAKVIEVPNAVAGTMIIGGGVPSGGCAGYNCGLDNDPNLVAWWKFDNTDVDSTDNAYDLNSTSESYDSDAADHKQGTHSIYYSSSGTARSEYADTSLGTDFPGKSGQSESDFSVAFWYKPDLFISGDYEGIVAKYESGTRSWGFLMSNASSTTAKPLIFIIGYNGGGSGDASCTCDTTMANDIWYYVVGTYTASSNTVTLDIWDSNANSYIDCDTGDGGTTQKSTTAAGDMSPDSAQLSIGRYWDSSSSDIIGWVDELLVFDSVINKSKWEALRDGTYGQ